MIARLLTVALALVAAAAAAACGGEDAAPLAECGPCGWESTGLVLESVSLETHTMVREERTLRGCVLREPGTHWTYAPTIRCDPLQICSDGDCALLVAQPNGDYRWDRGVLWEWAVP